MATRGRAELNGRFGTRGYGTYTDVFALEQSQPVFQRVACENLREPTLKVALLGVELMLRELGPVNEHTQPLKELRLERADREVPSVGARVDRVAREVVREHGRARSELLRAVCHRHDDVCALAGAFPLDQRCKHLGHRAERACRKIGSLDGWQRGRGVLEQSRPADVVQVVACALLVHAAHSEARERAVDRSCGGDVRADAEASGDARPERLEDHVGAFEEGTRESSLARKIHDDRFLAGVQRVVPLRRRQAHGVAARLLDADDPRAVPLKLARRERTREIAGEINDERPPERLHRTRTYHYPATALGERATGAEEKRRLILDAAVRVFAHKGFHTSRVGDIAEEAGVAHGLLYHYFSSKDEVLETIFRENWGVLVERIQTVEQSDDSARDQLRHVAAIILRTWRHQPDVVRVLVREIARSPEMQDRISDLVKPIVAIRRIIERGQESGEFRADLDPALAAVVFYGGIDEVLTGWVLGQLPSGMAEVEAAERTVVEVLTAGFSASLAAAD
jgi:TetR/AcrR family transcriptional regulator, fatty acid metabolism regulator protein